METIRFFKKMLKVLIIMAQMICGNLNAQTLYAIIFADTDTESQILREGITVSKNEMRSELKKVADNLNIFYHETNATDKDFNADNLRFVISQYNPGSEDILFFYYIGHGINKPELNDKWPQLAFRKSYSDATKELISFSNIVNQFEEKRQRLLVAIAEACNDIKGETEYFPEEILGMASLNFSSRDVERLRDLYIRSEGTIICSSSEPGQTSLVSQQNGGYFGKSFIEVHKEITSLASDADWNTLMEKAKLRTKTLVEIKKPGKIQLPQYTVKIRGIDKPDFAWQNQINNQQNVYSNQPQNFNYQANYFNPMRFLVAKVVFFGNQGNVYFVMPDNYITQYHAYYGLQIVGYRAMPLQPQFFQWDIVSYYNQFQFNRWGVDYYGRIMEWNNQFGWQFVGIVYY